MKDRRTNHNGFTLLELLIVLAISVTVIALVPPRVSSVIDSSKIKSATREFVAVLKTTRALAISQQKEAILTINIEQHSYQSIKHSDSLSLPKKTLLKLTTAESEQNSESEGNIRFFPDGSSTGGQISLAHAELEFIVDVNWLTGKVIILP